MGEELYHFVVDEAENCPLFSKGDRMIIRPPEVTLESNAICAEAVGAFVQLLKTIPPESARTSLSEPSSLICPGCTGDGARTTFHLEVVGVQEEEKSDEKIRYLLDLLRGIPMFKPVQERSLKEIIRHLGVQRFGARERILNKGDTGRNLFIIVKGKVEVLQTDEEGHTNVIATLKDGDCFGEMSLITGDACSADIQTAGDVLCLVMKKESFDQILEKFPSLNIYFTKLLSQRLKRTSRAVADELEKGIIGRLSLISLPEMVQAMAVSRRTGILRLSSKGEVAEIAFKDGAIFQSRYGDLEGEAAFYELVKWKSGNFRFQPTEGEFEQKITMDTMTLLMEGLRQLDEAERTAAQPS
ncbi:MAG: DUF4388 domain-containing protein [Planctomycetota bacterium]|nr:DUF4388 domain-containing protein [Planctomycetota bacterium]